ncbi:MAG: hypothetical protein PHF46_04285 [Candidatus Gracilibacteria bacterium]|nr:hypothetical protein [Candidatus Gracilibacteria bacterium]
MNEIIIKPLEGIEIKGILNSKIISFGMDKKDIIKILGNPESIEENEYDKYDTFYYSNNFLQLSFSINIGKLSYVEIFHHYPNKIIFNKIEIFKTKSSTLVEIFKKEHIINSKNPEVGYSYIYNDIELSLWRPSIPEKILEDTGENDYEKGIYFTTVGIGEKGTWSNYNFD